MSFDLSVDALTWLWCLDCVHGDHVISTSEKVVSVQSAGVLLLELCSHIVLHVLDSVC